MEASLSGGHPGLRARIRPRVPGCVPRSVPAPLYSVAALLVFLNEVGTDPGTFGTDPGKDPGTDPRTFGTYPGWWWWWWNRTRLGRPAQGALPGFLMEVGPRGGSLLPTRPCWLPPRFVRRWAPGADLSCRPVPAAFLLTWCYLDARLPARLHDVWPSAPEPH